MDLVSDILSIAGLTAGVIVLLILTVFYFVRYFKQEEK